ncbi:MAG: (Fe-S)-binding protein [Proteobacteria bacterium]|nr:(Fe-S)-binding protein [Pseudomonadota bacterium]
MGSPVGLFATCLADGVRPSVALATYALLCDSGAQVFYPPSQTCCGQISFNSGYHKETRAIIEKCTTEFATCTQVVMPSGSCCGMLRTAMGELFSEDDPEFAFGKKCLELSEYLQQVNYQPHQRTDAFSVTYHDSCAGLRELGVKQVPRQLLQKSGVRIIEMADAEECCGFGGRFSTQFGALSTAMATRKCEHIIAANADAVVMGDVGCMVQIEGRLRRLGSNLPVLHWSEILVGEGIAGAAIKK